MLYSPARVAGGFNRVLFTGLLFAFLLAVPDSAFSQETPEAEPDSAAAEPVIMQPIAVTATRDPKELFVIAAPVSVLICTPSCAKRYQ